MDTAKKPGLKPFLFVWFGQVISQLGSAMTSFGISIWLFEQTGTATALTWAMAAYMLPNVVLSPIAGTLVDRFDRKKILILADGVAGLNTIVMVVLFLLGRLDVWHIITLNFVTGSFQSLQWPAFSSAITMMVEKEQYARVSGLQSIGQSLSQIIAPVLAAAMIAFAGLRSIFILDIVSFTFAIIVLFFVAIPNPPKTDEGKAGRGTFWQETKYGFTYIFGRPGLLGLQSVFLVLNFIIMFGIAITTPLILARSNNSEATLGTVQALSAVGGILGGLLLTTWGGPRRKVDGVLGGMIFATLCGVCLFGVANGVVLWAVAGFCQMFAISILNGTNQAIWQAKVAPDVQGRVFAVRRLIAQAIMPISIAVSGPLADRVFEPAMRGTGRLATRFGWLVGNEAGSGMSLMMIIAGLIGAAVPLLAYTIPAIRNVETLLPDHIA